jgi:hypothetical protein
MNTAMKLGAFAFGLAAVFGAAYGTGRAAGPVTAADSRHSGSSDAHSGDTATGHGDRGKDETTSGRMPGGLLVSDHGYTFIPVPAATGEFAFRITGPDGGPVTGYDVEHDKRMHLIVVRRDVAGFRHVHPRMDSDGTWRVTSPLGEPGSWRAFADFKPTGGAPLTLGVDLAVPGAFSLGPQVTFYAEVPSAGTYRLLLDFQHTDGVRTAEFTMVAGHLNSAATGPSSPAPGSSTARQSEPGHGHGGQEQ